MMGLVFTFFSFAQIQPGECGKHYGLLPDRESRPSKGTMADLVVFSARIYTAEDSDPWVEAIAVKDGVFSYVGDFGGVVSHIAGYGYN
jgi:hypothetical protein